MSAHNNQNPLSLLSPDLTRPDNHEREEIDIARRWLRTCLGSHEACWNRHMKARDSHSHAGSRKLPNIYSFHTLPTRLISINSCLDEIRSIHLVSCQEAANSYSDRGSWDYLTLSHCWGGADIVKLKKANLIQFHENIPLEWLPRTFLDAVRITSLLGYQYLWIDSLCIIQDNVEDWRFEAAMMGSIYKNAILTIAALGAYDSHGGCFSNHKAPPYTTPDPTSPDMKLFSAAEAEKQQPLHRRAWVMQERCLSLRTLNFGANQISWDCISGRATFLSTDMQPNQYSFSLKLRFDDIVNSDIIQHKHWAQNWWYFIMTYTSCSLTFVTDRWEAIKGLATEVQQACNQVIFYGLWLQNFTNELLWAALEPVKERLDIGAPSWSWLSTIGEVRNLYHHQAGLDIHAQLELPSLLAELTAEDMLNPSENKLPHEIWITALVARITLMQDVRNPRKFCFADIIPDEVQRDFYQRDGECSLDAETDGTWKTWAVQIARTTDYVSVGLVIVADETREGVWKRVGRYESNDAHRRVISPPLNAFTTRAKIILV